MTKHHYNHRIDDGESIGEILDSSRGGEWRRIFAQFPEFFDQVASTAKEKLVSALHRAVSKSSDPWGGLFDKHSIDSEYHFYYHEPTISWKKGIDKLGVDGITSIRAEIGYQLVCADISEFDLLDIDLVQKLCDITLRAETIEILDKSVRMWLALRRLSEIKSYRQQDEVRQMAVENFLLSLVEDTPILWAESLHIVLGNAEVIGPLVESITITLSQKSDDVFEALKFIAEFSDGIELREYARGILQIVNGASSPQPETVSRLLDHLSRLASTRIQFPHPLSPISATWLSSNDAERQLRSGLLLGLSEFKQDFTLQGVKNERALVQSLLTELTVPFRTDRPEITVLGKNRQRSTPKIAIEHRTLVETEETLFGPDIAFIVNSMLYETMKFQIAEFVQVKKPTRVRDQWSNSWKIDIEQLEKLLNTSATAAYWLVDRDGTVLVLPAKYIKAWTPPNAGKSFAIGFNKVRSAAIPVDQFLVELLLGAWIGNGQPVAMKIARGEVNGLVPRNLVEVQVSLHDVKLQ